MHSQLSHFCMLEEPRTSNWIELRCHEFWCVAIQQLHLRVAEILHAERGCGHPGIHFFQLTLEPIVLAQGS